MFFQPLKLHYLLFFGLLACQAPGTPADSSSPSAEPTIVPTAVSSPGPERTPAAAAFDTQIDMTSPLRFPDGLTLSFYLKNDSRCPRNVTCIRAGDVTLNFTFELPEQVAESFDLTLDATEDSAMLNWQDYTLTLFAVDPYPVQSEGPVTAVQYSARVQVSKAP